MKDTIEVTSLQRVQLHVIRDLQPLMRGQPPYEGPNTESFIQRFHYNYTNRKNLLVHVCVGKSQLGSC